MIGDNSSCSTGEWIVPHGPRMPAAKSCWSFPTSQTGQEPTEVGFSWNLNRNLPRQSAVTIDVTTSKRIRCFFHVFSYMFAFLPLHEWIVMDLPSYWSWINFAVVIHIVTSWFFWQLVSEQRRKPDAMKTECKACNSIHQISSRLWPSVDAVQVIAMATEEFHLLLCRGIPQSTGQAVKRCHGIFGHLWSNMATSHPFFGDKAIVGSTGDGKIGWIWLDIAKKYLQIFIKPCVGVKILKAHQDFSHGLVLASCKSSTNFSRSHGHWPLFFSAATLKFWMLEASKSERSE